MLVEVEGNLMTNMPVALRFAYATLVMKRRWVDGHKPSVSVDAPYAIPPTVATSPQKTTACETEEAGAMDLLTPLMAFVLETSATTANLHNSDVMAKVACELRAFARDHCLVTEVVRALTSLFDNDLPTEMGNRLSSAASQVMLCFESRGSEGELIEYMPTPECEQILEGLIALLVHSVSVPDEAISTVSITRLRQVVEVITTRLEASNEPQDQTLVM
ncbi:hypothetical protein Poli38472_000960 [Pythium oligandrum]|uniref:Uncharacterized protein n=1 Tax=Pythium oligandrum TaxID=41045 RepID=A0A8K1CDC5_PYTOL|nr:hypothetical protein Poli38472_000960 [Pythium oligandrum]|eukprot:TMW60918.1 hypothetical protein Poli38472_000960 [Pythium oligandrum]